jgi:peptide deformylase
MDVMQRPVVMFPNPLLRTPAAHVAQFDPELKQTATDLLETMRAAPGIGITAPHIGLLKRIVVIQLSSREAPLTFINPEIVWTSDDRARAQEGSISMPGIMEEIERPARVKVSYQDLTGAEQRVEASGLLSVCLQHEIDQLNGIFWIERLSRLKRERAIKRFEKLRQAVKV